jgi:hypothetical protein
VCEQRLRRRRGIEQARVEDVLGDVCAYVIGCRLERLAGRF